MSKIKYELQPFADISDYSEGFEVVTTSIGFDHRIYMLLVDKRPERIDGMFVQTRTDRKVTYKVLTIGEDSISETYLYNQRFNLHFVQPLGADKLLAAGTRARRYSDKEFERNGKIFDLDGHLLNEILLGDGIEHVQTTQSGLIWRAETIKFVDEDGLTIQTNDRDFRGETLVLRDGTKLYQVRLSQLLIDIK